MTDSSMLSPDTQGKVRDLYDLGDRLLLVASDRISAFDFVLPDAIPYKGEVLTKLSLFWFELLSDVVPNHFLSADVADLPEEFAPHAEWLRGRFMLVRKASVYPVECIVQRLPGRERLEGVPRSRDGVRCPPPGRTRRVEPARRSDLHAIDQGRDRRSRREHQLRPHGRDRRRADRRGAAHQVGGASTRPPASTQRTRGVIIADTKFEFGEIDGRVTLVDEVLTPDSSRFWPAEHLRARRWPAKLRQAIRSRLARGQRLGQAAAGSRLAGRRDRGHQQKVHPSVRA